ncbi:MAG: methyltransferase domain-containing protein [Pseudomonadota bacterium]
MREVEQAVAAHYTTGALIDRVTGALRALGIDPAKATASDLKAGDEFHTGGLAATEHVFSHLTLGPDDVVLDVGCGIGGTSRYIADTFGAQVTGVDLTQEFVNAARALTAMVGLSGKVSYMQGSALALPVPDQAYDLAVMMHVGMNIADKTALMADVARCLKPGGHFAVFDVMKSASEAEIAFPLPWSSVPDTSFLHRPEDYAAAAKAAGMHLKIQEDRTQFSKDFFAEVHAKTARDGPSPLGIHLMMGETAPEKFKNYVANLHAGLICPTEMVFRKAGA